MSEQVNVRGVSDSLYEAMTKQEVLTAIVNAVQGGTIGNIDTGFVTTIKELNHGQGLMFWVGTTAEYEAIQNKQENVLYIKTDDTSAQDIEANFNTLSRRISGLDALVGSVSADSITYKDVVERLKATVGYSSKNLLYIDAQPTTLNNIEFSVDPEKGWASTYGTASAETRFTVGTVTNSTSEAQKMYLSGGAGSGSSSTYYLYAIDTTTWQRPKQWDGATQSGACYNSSDVIQILIPAGHSVEIRILFRNGATAPTEKFNPMVRSGDIADNSFEPFRLSADAEIRRRLRYYNYGGGSNVTIRPELGTLYYKVFVKNTTNPSTNGKMYTCLDVKCNPDTGAPATGDYTILTKTVSGNVVVTNSLNVETGTDTYGDFIKFTPITTPNGNLTFTIDSVSQIHRDSTMVG